MQSLLNSNSREGQPSARCARQHEHESLNHTLEKWLVHALDFQNVEHRVARPAKALKFTSHGGFNPASRASCAPTTAVSASQLHSETPVMTVSIVQRFSCVIYLCHKFTFITKQVVGTLINSPAADSIIVDELSQP